MSDMPIEVSTAYNWILNMMTKNVEGTQIAWGHFLLILAVIIFIYWWFERRE
jgi:hypothetical protein